MKSIRDIIGDRQTVAVDAHASVSDVARQMAAHHIGAVPVVDDGRLVGIFSERDILTRVVAADRNPLHTTVSEVMSSQLIVADCDESYEACLSRMQQAHVRHLIVLEKGGLAGIASFRDLLAADLDEKSEAITLLNAYVHYIPANLQKVKT
jgi:CBS domain-containing protein